MTISNSLQIICSQTPPPMIQRCFLASVFQRLCWGRAAASCAAGRHYPVRLEETRNLFVCVQRLAHQVSPHSVVRRLAGARYQLDIATPQAGIVGNGRHQEDPVVRSCDRYPHVHTYAICRNVLTPLASRFETHGIQRTRGRSSANQQQRCRWEGSESRASERPREASWV